MKLPNDNSSALAHRPKLVFVWNYLNWGGAQIYYLAIMKVARRTWDITVILPAESSPEIIKFLAEVGVAYKLVDYHLDLAPAETLMRRLSRQFNRLSVEFRTFRELLKFNVRDTVFHIEIAPWQSVAFLTAMSLRQAKVFLTLHNALPKAPRWRTMVWKSRLRFVSSLAGINFFVSNVDTKERLRGWVNDEFWARIRVTFTAVHPPQIAEAAGAAFERSAVLLAHDIPPDDFIVLCVGQFIDRKGRWTFLESAGELHRSNSDISFVWVTPELPSMEDRQKIDRFGLGEKFRLILSEKLGGQRLDVLKFFRIADVFVLPSYVEGLPIALLEAMALERPSISTNVYAIPEAIKHLETGILIEPGNGGKLADAISMLKNDTALRGRLARTGRQYVLEHFDERDAARLAVEAYEAALAGVR